MTAQRRAIWRPPQEGWTKINIDGSFVEQTCEAGIGSLQGIVRVRPSFWHGEFYSIVPIRRKWKHWLA